VEHEDVRQSDRVAVELLLEVLGTDANGRDFFEAARTTLVAHQGAKIVMARKLAPHQEITLRCLETGREAVGRVVGQTGASEDGYTYGISLLNPEAKFWGIDFPRLSESKDAVGRVVLECQACHSKEVAHLDEFELEVFEVNQSLSRHCKRCTDATVWKRSFGGPAGEPVKTPPPPVTPAERQEKRREPRGELRVTACVRSKELGEDIVTTRNVSRGGACFESSRRYTHGASIEVAIPYAKGGGNIFVTGRITWAAQPSPGTETNLYGVAYLEHKT
jgi:PilZ domain-containing protein